jgi:hypothetical protein
MKSLVTKANRERLANEDALLGSDSDSDPASADEDDDI